MRQLRQSLSGTSTILTRLWNGKSFLQSDEEILNSYGSDLLQHQSAEEQALATINTYENNLEAAGIPFDTRKHIIKEVIPFLAMLKEQQHEQSKDRRLSILDDASPKNIHEWLTLHPEALQADQINYILFQYPSLTMSNSEHIATLHSSELRDSLQALSKLTLDDKAVTVNIFSSYRSKCKQHIMQVAREITCGNTKYDQYRFENWPKTGNPDACCIVWDMGSDEASRFAAEELLKKYGIGTNSIASQSSCKYFPVAGAGEEFKWPTQAAGRISSSHHAQGLAVDAVFA